MDATKIFPYCLIVMDMGASIVYLAHGDIRHCVYWLSAAILTVTVTI